ncbi:MAG: hypothetical protein Q8L09_02370 [Candidatus Moranbacteria bacterium]|nr:hypothetical protein [Candidatus Moranbacteria bacterium]
MIREGLRKDINPRPGKPEDLVTATPAATSPDAEPEPVEKSGAGLMGGEPGHDRAGTEEKREPKRFSEFEGGSRGSRIDQPPVPLATLEEERKIRKEFDQVRKEFDENEKKIAAARHKSKGKLKIIFEALGIWKRNIEDEEIKGYLENRKTLHPKLMAAGRHVLSGNEQEWAEFETNYHETMVAIKSRLEEDGIRAKDATFNNAFVGLANVSKNYREFISKQFLKDGKLTVKGVAKGVATAAAIGFAATSLIAASLPALGIVAVGSAGASAAMAWRAFGSVGAGYALKKRMEKGFVEKKEKEVQADVLKIIEAKKQKTDEEWNAFIAEREGLKSITGEEQAFADKDAKHKKLALGLAGGTFLAGTIASYYAADIKGFFGQAWEKVTHSFGGGKTGFYDAAHSSITDAEMPAGAGKGIINPDQKHGPIVPGYEQVEHWEFTGGTAKVGEGGSVWRSTRDIFMQHFDEYGYSDDEAKRLFGSFKDQGILKRLGIKGVEDFSGLTDDQKHKIWAEWRTVGAIKEQGIGNIVVHPGDSITLDADGHILLGETSGIKAGHIHDVPRAGGAGQAVAEASAPGGAGRAVADNHPRGASTYETTGKRSALDQALDNRQKMAQENYAKKAAISAQTHEALVQSRGPLIADRIAETAAIDNTQTHKWMDFIQERIYGEGTTVDWREPASEFRKRMLGSFLTSDQPMGPPANVGEQQQYWRAAQELNRKLGPTLGNESTESWLQRGLAQGKVTPEEIVRTLKRVVNA